MNAPSPSPAPPRHRRFLAVAAALAFVAAAGAGAVLAAHAWVGARGPGQNDGPALVLRMREVARLTALDVELHQKVTFTPDPPPSRGLAHDVAAFLKDAVRPDEGTAIVFGTAHLGVDLARLDESAVHTHGDVVEIVLPPLVAHVEVLPEDTEIVRSNLDSAQTGALLEVARERMERAVEGDRALQERARAATKAALTALFQAAGFATVRFVDALPGIA